MKSLHAVLILFFISIAMDAKAMDSSYSLPAALSDWNHQSNSFEKSGRKVTTHAIYSPDRTHIITIAFVSGYTDKNISKDHFEALISSFAKEGLKNVQERKRVTMYGMEGAQVLAQGIVQEKEFKGKGTILKSGDSELTIMLFATGIDLDAPAFAVALSGLGIASK